MQTTCITCQETRTIPFSWQHLVTFKIFQPQPLLDKEDWLCATCLKDLPWLEDNLQCDRCDRSLAGLSSSFTYAHQDWQICYDCERWLASEEQLRQEPDLCLNPVTEDSGEEAGRILMWNRSVWQYNEVVQDLIAQYKFKGNQSLKYFFASLLWEQWRNLIESTDPSIQRLSQETDLVTCIPLAPDRLIERGYNQAEQIGELFAARSHLPFVPDALIRQGDLDKQSQKDRQARLKELWDKFINNPVRNADIHNKRVCLIDDIYTTGATIYAAAYALRSAGAKSVISLTMAR
ncbi:ComF family protein [Caldalkalibacillus salinus]|uniref:ComF family protein n=1 Tax=Caldalkalibacillus salinus TaxID=2803787 RepID=UPI001920EDFB|nr:ComF family protein [Caldalkalibacillus salinus]